MTHAESNPPNPDLDLQPDAPVDPAPSGRRRATLVISGLSLLTLGVVLNAEPLGLLAEPEPTLVEQEEEAPAVLDEEVAGGQGQRHRGEEGKLGKASHSKSGLYAMKAPTQAQGHFLASPQGGAFAIGDDDEDIWGGLTGTEVGQAYGVGGLGLSGTGRGAGGVSEAQYRAGPTKGSWVESESTRTGRLGHFIPTRRDNKSTFSIDVDTGSYALVRRALLERGSLPDPDSVRPEELLNYFDYDYARPHDAKPFAVTTEVGPSPWAPERRLVRIGLRGATPARMPPRNLVYLVDVSGSMDQVDKLPRVKQGLLALTEQLRAEDHLAIVTYANGAKVELEAGTGADQAEIRAVIEGLKAYGSTDGGAGIELAYQRAEANFIEGGANRVILATDGDFNVGVSSHEALIELIEAKRDSGVFLSVIGFGVDGADATMEQVADHGNGNYAVIDNELEVRKVFVDDASATLQTIAKDVKLQVEFDPDQVAEQRLIGYVNRRLEHRDFADDEKDAGEIGAGHTVTAIYEILPTAAFGHTPDQAIMTLDLRYKAPQGDQSELMSVPIRARETTLAATSNDFRFAAAVAAFGENLHGRDEFVTSYADIVTLAMGALGRDDACYRHQFVDMVWEAGSLAGETIAKPDTRCTPLEPRASLPSRIIERAIARPTSVAVPEAAPTQEGEDWMTFVLEVLRLLPPLLALPLFVMASRRPRRSPKSVRRV